MSKKGKPPQAIMIGVSGNTVWAHVANAYGQNLECVAGYAKCHPNDTFDFYEGARIALARAFGKDPFPKTDEPKPMVPSFQVGDIVRTGDYPFVSACRDCIAKVICVKIFESHIEYKLSVRESDGRVTLQFCDEDRKRPAPLTLLWREEK